jgi:hypothetical protein
MASFPGKPDLSDRSADLHNVSESLAADQEKIVAPESPSKSLEPVINMIMNLQSISGNEYVQRFAKSVAGLVWEGWSCHHFTVLKVGLSRGFFNPTLGRLSFLTSTW